MQKLESSFIFGKKRSKVGEIFDEARRKSEELQKKKCETCQGKGWLHERDDGERRGSGKVCPDCLGRPFDDGRVVFE